ncbi:hypothetical protein GIB67_027260 [Kingdonia uniflora]|uniref:Aminotransferase-like plant mobile domain-containing protein n=1 Tax=Kingdonia uniflora TaxID=39325 RepID=A0A7J7KYE0_9MAGN|nr:hypothetical protein GIB67_027260 [Kingdonia uniflora]
MSVTTVGYGDRAFHTLSRRLFTSVWLLFSTLVVILAFLYLGFLYLAESRIDKRHMRITKCVLHRDITVDDLIAADVDHHCYMSMPPKGRGKLPTTSGRKIVPTTSLRKRLNEEGDDPSHPNYNNPPRVPAKKRKTHSTRVPLRDTSISGSLSRVSVTPEEESSSTSDSQGESAEDFRGEDAGTPETQSSTDCFPYAEDKDLPYTEDLGYLRVYHHSPSWELGKEIERVQNIVNVWGLGRIRAISYKHYNSALITAFAERWHPETNSFHFKWGEMTITLEDVSRLIGLRVDGDLTVVKGVWGALAVKEIWRKCMYLPDSVYPDLKAGGQGISLSLKKIVEFFDGKVGINVHDSASASSIKLSSRMVGKAYMLYVLGSFLFPTKKGTYVSVKYLSFFQDQHVIFDPYVEKREDKHMFEEVVSFTGLICTPEHKEPYYPDRVQRQFNRRKWRDSITLMRGRKVHDGIPVCSEGYFEWFNSVSFTKLRPDVVNLGEDADYDGARVLEASSGVSQRENVEVPQNQNEGGGGLAEVVEDPARSILVQALEVKTSESVLLMEATGRMQAEIEAKNLANSICEKKLNEKTLECETNKKLLKDQILKCESNKKLAKDLRMQLAAKVNETETLDKINDKLMDKVYLYQIEVPLPLNIVPHPEENVGEAEMWKQKYEELHAKFEEAQRRLRGDFEDPEDLTYEELVRQFMKFLTIAQEGPKGEYKDDIILSGRGEYQEMIDSRLKKIDHKTNLRQSLYQPFNWFQLDIRDVERDGNTTFRVAASYAYHSQMKFLNVKVSLCTLMTKKPSYWKNIFSQRLDVAYNDLGERRYETLLRAFKFDVVLVEYLYMGHLLATYYEKVVIFISNKEALTFLPLFWPKANNKITKEKRFENILVDSIKYWWVGMTSDKNLVKLKTKYQLPIPSLSTLWWEHVKLDIPDAFVKQCVKNYFDAPNEAWMKLMKDNNVNSLDYNLNNLILC